MEEALPHTQLHTTKIVWILLMIDESFLFRSHTTSFPREPLSIAPPVLENGKETCEPWKTKSILFTPVCVRKLLASIAASRCFFFLHRHVYHPNTIIIITIPSLSLFLLPFALQTREPRFPYFEAKAKKIQSAWYQRVVRLVKFAAQVGLAGNVNHAKGKSS